MCIKKPLESVRGPLVRHLLESTPTRTDYNGLHEKKYSFIRCFGWMFLYVRLPGERPHSAEQRYKLLLYLKIYF
jgi:hypothetical protein